MTPAVDVSSVLSALPRNRGFTTLELKTNYVRCVVRARANTCLIVTRANKEGGDDD
jgi:hypothetical protein